MWPITFASPAPTLSIDDVHVWRIDLDTGSARREQLAAHLSADERARAARFHTPELARRYRVAHGALREILGAYLDQAPAAVAFTADPQGKPQLTTPTLAFNLTHAGPLALVALTAGRAVGVDVEQVCTLDDARLVAERFFAPEEVLAWDRLTGAETMRAFFACWTRKEAYLKALGSGLARPLDSFVVNVDPAEPARLLQDVVDASASARWRLATLDLGSAAIGAVAVEAPLNDLQTFTLAAEPI